MRDYTSYGIEKRRKPHTGRKSVRKVISFVLKLAAAALFVIVIGGGLFAYSQIRSIVAEAPDLSGVSLAPSQAATYIYGRDGKREQKLTLPEANRDLVNLSQVPEQLRVSLCLPNTAVENMTRTKDQSGEYVVDYVRIYQPAE